jgi:3-hydroxy acid dehydrogenase/malonic semialdehyde reductase
MDKKIVLITGATSGIGEACARLFAEKGHELIITGRRKERLAKLEKELWEKHECRSLSLNFDVRSRTETEAALSSLPDAWKKVDILLNNAGLASGLDTIQEGDIDDWEKMIDTNVKGLLYVSRGVLPWMIQRKKGHVINIGSTAGKEVYAKGNVYCASKHAVDALTKGMRIDLLGKGIKVTQISPGAAETEFSLVRFHGDSEHAKKIYDGYRPMAPQDIAGLVLMATELPEHLCINDLVVTSLDQANSFYINKTN